MNLDIYNTDEESDEADDSVKEAETKSVESKNELHNANRRHPVSEELKIKFEKLKSERLKLAKKNERRRNRRLVKSWNSSTDNAQSTRQDLIQNTAHSINQNANVYLEPDDHEHLLIKTYEKHINSAIKSSDLEAAEKLSDELSKHESEMNAAKLAKASDFCTNKNKTNKRAARQPLFWRFEPKKKWETKSNM